MDTCKLQIPEVHCNFMVDAGGIYVDLIVLCVTLQGSGFG